MAKVLGLQPFAGAVGRAIFHCHNARKINLGAIKACDELLGIVQLVVAGKSYSVVAVHIDSIVWLTLRVKWATQHSYKA